ncbi:hypothetical protein GCM10011607_28950 [Shewanella inventionis]|uniref:Uncharacterized protein n=1 Tax=Shewanella inventionis TaxID=1738770 RepID=A0ABQ1JI18_9GAMM|nr:hypothetical protein [Shewanella inventionis]GGB66529.1 hypothetical protein GCM10011607_28950 [Shewanella inventionis]
MERIKLIQQLELALQYAKSDSNDEIIFDIADKSFHIIFSKDNPLDDIPLHQLLAQGEYVKSIQYLADWLGKCLDIDTRFSCGLFRSDDPRGTGVAYEYGEGEKLTEHLTKVATSSGIWYLTLYRSFSKNENSDFNELYSQMKRDLGFDTVELQVALVRLLPKKSKEDSIESISPPLRMKEMYPERRVGEEEAFELLSDLYTTYKEWEDEQPGVKD